MRAGSIAKLHHSRRSKPRKSCLRGHGCIFDDLMIMRATWREHTVQKWRLVFSLSVPVVSVLLAGEL